MLRDQILARSSRFPALTPSQIFVSLLHICCFRSEEVVHGSTGRRLAGANGAVGNVAMEALAQECLRLRERVTEVEHGNAVADDFERIGLVLGGGAGETVQHSVIERLQGLQALPAFAFFLVYVHRHLGHEGFCCGVDLTSLVGLWRCCGARRGVVQHIQSYWIGAGLSSRDFCVSRTLVSHEAGALNFCDTLLGNAFWCGFLRR